MHLTRARRSPRFVVYAIRAWLEQPACRRLHAVRWFKVRARYSRSRP